MTMQTGDLLFVYGSLRSGEAADLSLRSGAERIGDDEINGALYEVGWYPGVKLPPDNGFNPEQPTVKGEVFRLNDPALIRHLDSYEGYPHLFNRTQVETRNSRFVWVYTYNGNVSGDNRVVSGDWLNPEPNQEAEAA